MSGYFALICTTASISSISAAPVRPLEGGKARTDAAAHVHGGVFLNRIVVDDLPNYFDVGVRVV
jgi:hypothetical protein